MKKIKRPPQQTRHEQELSMIRMMVQMRNYLTDEAFQAELDRKEPFHYRWTTYELFKGDTRWQEKYLKAVIEKYPEG